MCYNQDYLVRQLRPITGETYIAPIKIEGEVEYSDFIADEDSDSFVRPTKAKKRFGK